MRVFAALPVPARVSAAIVGAFANARMLAPKARWVAAEGMHLTLHFFGEIPDQDMPALSQVFDDPAIPRAPIDTQLGPLGFFPKGSSPRVLWIGLQKGVEELRSFWKALTEKLEPLRGETGALRGWSPDARGLNPHITLARAGSAPLSPHWSESVSVPPLEFTITECVLFQSILGAGGARYVPLKTVPLAGGSS